MLMLILCGYQVICEALKGLVKEDVEKEKGRENVTFVMQGKNVCVCVCVCVCCL